MSYKLWRNVTAYWMLLPALAVIGVFVIYPIIDAFLISFYKWNMMSPIKPFVGLDNYKFILQDRQFHLALFNTFYYVVVYVPVSILLGLLTAVLLNTKIRLVPFYRTAFFIPHVTTLAAVGVIWGWLFNDQFGLVNYLLRSIGIQPLHWLTDPHLTMLNMVILGVWQNLGYVAVIYLAALQSISREYYEASDVDGANAGQKFWSITLPLLSPATFFLVIMTTIESFKVFMQVYVLYGGSSGPNGSGLTLIYYMFLKGFSDYRMGYATASAFVTFFMIFCLILVQMLFSRKVHYEG